MLMLRSPGVEYRLHVTGLGENICFRSLLDHDTSRWIMTREPGCLRAILSADVFSQHGKMRNSLPSVYLW